MDAARVAMGQGWPFAAGLWSNDEVKEVGRRSRETRMQGQAVLVTFEQDKSNPPEGAEPERSGNVENRVGFEIRTHRIAYPDTHIFLQANPPANVLADSDLSDCAPALHGCSPNRQPTPLKSETRHRPTPLPR